MIPIGWIYRLCLPSIYALFVASCHRGILTADFPLHPKNQAFLLPTYVQSSTFNSELVYSWFNFRILSYYQAFALSVNLYQRPPITLDLFRCPLVSPTSKSTRMSLMMAMNNTLKRTRMLRQRASKKKNALKRQTFDRLLTPQGR